MKVEKGEDDISNYNPSCRRCNYHKSVFSIEQFREQSRLKQNRIRKSSNVLLLERFGLITFNKPDVVFYFEKQDLEDKT